jgi:hypothetical protein
MQSQELIVKTTFIMVFLVGGEADNDFSITIPTNHLQNTYQAA